MWENGTVVLRASTVWLRGVKLWGGRIVEATIKAIVDATEGVRLQVSVDDETARIYLWHIQTPLCAGFCGLVLICKLPGMKSGVSTPLCC